MNPLEREGETRAALKLYGTTFQDELVKSVSSELRASERGFWVDTGIGMELGIKVSDMRCVAAYKVVLCGQIGCKVSQVSGVGAGGA